MSTVLEPVPAGPPPRPAKTPVYDVGVCTLPLAATTWAGFRDWATTGAYPDRGRVAFLGQEVFVDMSPERVNSHTALKGEISAVLHHLVRAENLGRLLPDRALVSNERAELATEPDATFLSWAAIRDGRVRFVPTADGLDAREVVGTPDMVLEIVSPSSVRKDTLILRERYHLAGVPEYWLLDARGDEIVFELLRHTPAGYVAAEPRDGWYASVVFAREFRVTREPTGFAGLWQYTLHVRPLGAA